MVAVVAAGLATTNAFADQIGTVRVNLGSNGWQGNAASNSPEVSADGRYVAFQSHASNLIPLDSNDNTDVFVRDVEAGILERVSVSDNEGEASGASLLPALSADGRYVAFQSTAANLVPGDTNKQSDIFVRDRVQNTTTLVSVATDGTHGNGKSSDARISADGRYVVFSSESTNLSAGTTTAERRVFIHDRVDRTTVEVSVRPDGGSGDKASYGAALSADGRVVAFLSTSTNLVAGDTNRLPDAFARDLETGVTTRVSVDSDGKQVAGGVTTSTLGTAISGDGRFVTFYSEAADLVPGDTNRQKDYFRHDRETGAVIRVNLGPDGAQADRGDLLGYPAPLSADGRFVTFTSSATNLVPGDTNAATDVFVRDTLDGVTTRVSVSADGGQGSHGSTRGVITPDGKFVVFSSDARNLVADDVNNRTDVFLHRRS